MTVCGRWGERTVLYNLGDVQDKIVKGAVRAQRNPIGLRGREFSFKITLQKGCVINKMTVEYDELGGNDNGYY